MEKSQLKRAQSRGSSPKSLNHRLSTISEKRTPHSRKNSEGAEEIVKAALGEVSSPKKEIKAERKVNKASDNKKNLPLT